MSEPPVQGERSVRTLAWLGDAEFEREVRLRVARRGDFPTDRDIVLYCACPNEEAARRAAQILRSRGFSRTRPLAGGLDAWIASGRSVVTKVPAVVVEHPRKAA
jgi:rhodanese-related sulfurtransferase